MQRPNTKHGAIQICCVLALLCACEGEKPKSESAPKPTVSAAPAAAPTPTPAPTPAPAEAPQEPGARSKVSTELTADRRTALETKYPGAKGFLVAKDLEDKLKANKALKDKKAAIAAFDKAAKGKWILFAGPAVNLTDDGFDVGIVYTAQLPNDPIGMSRQFFEVTLSEVEGYAKDKFTSGGVVVALAKYAGNGKATPGHEAVSSGVWK